MTGVLVLGELNVDLILRGGDAFPALGREVLVEDCAMTLGSASAIAAVGLARLGTPVAFVGKVGADAWGTYCVGAMAAAGVDVSRVARDAGLRTGITVSISMPGDRALVTFPGSIAALTGADVPDTVLSGFAHLHLSSYFLQCALRPAVPGIFKRASALGLTVSLDPGFDPLERWADDLVRALGEVDLFLPNQVELCAIAKRDRPGEALRRLRNGRTTIVAKLGRAGCLTLQDDTELAERAPDVEVVDTTGAGDSFDAGFLHAWLEGRPLQACLRYGCACGALATRGLGGTTTQPDREELEAFLRTHYAS